MPYPVLGISDDYVPGLGPDCIEFRKPFTEGMEIVFPVRAKVENEGILRYIADGYAEYCCEVDCASTFFNKCYAQYSGDFRISIPRHELKGHVTLNTFVVAKRRIDDFRNADFNDDYRDASFHLEPGELLVKFPTLSYNLELKYDRLCANGTFMQISKGADENRLPWYDITGDKILVYLPPSLYKLYDEEMKGDRSYVAVIHASVAYAALMFALQFLYKSEYQEKAWADALKYRMNTEPALKRFRNSVDRKDIPEIAQILLGDPYRRMFRKYKEKNKRENMNNGFTEDLF